MATREELEQQKSEARTAERVGQRELNAAIVVARREETTAAARTVIATEHPALNVLDANDAQIVMTEARGAGDEATVTVITEALVKLGYEVHWRPHPRTMAHRFVVERRVGVTTKVIDPGDPSVKELR